MECAFKATNFNCVLLSGRSLCVQVIRMKESFLLWICDDKCALNDLAVAMPPIAGNYLGNACKVVGDPLSETSVKMAQKLSKRLNCQVFVSLNVDTSEHDMEIQLMSRIIEELTVNKGAFLALLAITYPAWEQVKFRHCSGSYGLNDELSASIRGDSSTVGDWDDSVSDISITSRLSHITSRTLRTVKSYKTECQSVLSSKNQSTGVTQEIANNHSKRIFIVIMSLLIAAAASALATFMYSTSVLQKMELTSIKDTLQRNLYCQPNAVRDIPSLTEEYVLKKQTGVVLLFLRGCEGCGKTHTINLLSEINPSWVRLVATHEHSLLNSLTEDEFKQKIESKLRSTTLNFIFVDDLSPLAEDSAFVEMKLKPLLGHLKFDKRLTFVVISMTEPFNTKVEPPPFLTDLYEYKIIDFEHMSEKCVISCAEDVIVALDSNPKNFKMERLLQAMDFVPIPESGQLVAIDGCKSVPISVAIYLEQNRQAVPSVDEQNVI